MASARASLIGLGSSGGNLAARRGGACRAGNDNLLGGAGPARGSAFPRGGDSRKDRVKRLSRALTGGPGLHRERHDLRPLARCCWPGTIVLAPACGVRDPALLRPDAPLAVSCLRRAYATALPTVRSASLTIVVRADAACCSAEQISPDPANRLASASVSAVHCTGCHATCPLRDTRGMKR